MLTLNLVLTITLTLILTLTLTLTLTHHHLTRRGSIGAAACYCAVVTPKNEGWTDTRGLEGV